MLSIGLFIPLIKFAVTLYIVLGAFIALMVLYSANAVYAVLCLVGTFLLVGFLFLVIGAEYLGLVLMIIYIGAIAILFLFILMLLDLRNLMKQRISGWQPIVGTLFLVVLVEYFLYSSQYSVRNLFTEFISVESHTTLPLSFFVNGDPLLVLSPVLYNTYFHYILGCGLILLYIMVGVVLLLSEWGSSPVMLGSVSNFSNNNKYLVQHNHVVKLRVFQEKNGL